MRGPLMRRAVAAVALAAAAGCATPPAPSGEAAPLASACPAGVPEGARCLRGIDSREAHYLIVVPRDWNGVLVVHAHGGPPLQAKRERADADIKRWSILVRAGYAYAASVFHQGGVAVRSAAEDTERVRRIFVAHVAQPRRTILHGQSWGANVAAKAAEMYAAPGMRSPYDAVLLTSGVLGGGTRSYDFRMDLRAVYQHYCHNHPRADEPQYPLAIGLPPEATLTPAQLRARVEECLGTAKSRTPEQARKSRAIAEVIHIPEGTIASHLAWGTFHFQDIVQKRTGGRSPFGNERVQYRGSPDDAALNAGVQRDRADPAAFARFEADAGLAGRIGVPVLTVHAIGDPTAFVELESRFLGIMRSGGSDARLVQVFSDHHEHSYLSDPTYPAALEMLLEWVEQGTKPGPADVAARCRRLEATYGPGCRIVPGYAPPPLESRVPAR